MKPAHLIALLLLTNAASISLTYLFLENSPGSPPSPEALPATSASESKLASSDAAPVSLPASFGSTARPSESLLLDQLNASSDPNEYSYLASLYSKSLDISSIQSAIAEWENERDPKKRSKVLQILYTAWAKQAPYEATLAAIGDNPQKANQRSQLVAAAFNELGVQSPELAIKLFKDYVTPQNPDAPQLHIGLSQIGYRLAQEANTQAIDAWINASDELKSGSRGTYLMRNFYTGLGRGSAQLSLEDANNLASRIAEPHDRINMLNSYLFTKEDVNPRAFVEWSLSVNLPAQEQSQLLASSVRRWSNEDGGFEAALTHISQLDTSTNLDPALNVLFNVAPKDDYETRLHLLTSINDQNTRERAAYNFARQSSGLDPQSRIDIAMTIKDASTRERAIERTLIDIATRDYEAAIETYQTLDALSPEAEQRLLKHLETRKPQE